MSNSRFRSLSLIFSAICLLIAAGSAPAQTAQFSYAQIPLGAGFTGVSSVALDGHGNLYVTDNNARAVKELSPGCVSTTCIRTLATGFTTISGVAVDASGNVFVSAQGSVVGPGAPPSESGGIYEIVAVNGSIPTASPTVLTLASGFNGPAGLAVDVSGNVFVADTYNNAVKEILAAGGYTTVNTLGNGFKNPLSVAVDASGNVFVADAGNSAAKEIVAVNGSIPASPTIQTLASGLNSPGGIAVDAGGNVFVADLGLTSDSTLYEILAVNGTIPSSPTVTKVFASCYSNFALDGKGDIYLNSGGATELEELETQAVSFGAVSLGQSTASVSLTFTFSGAQTIASTAALTLGAPGLDFAVASTSTCKPGASLSAGDTCNLDITFAPKYPGLRMGAAVLRDSSGNPIATGFVNGFGSGPQLGFGLGRQSILSNPYIGILADRGIAVDASGDVFISNAVTPPGEFMDEVPAGCTLSSCVEKLTGSFYDVWGAAIDGAGNLFLADTGAGNQLYELPAAGGYSTVKTITGNFSDPVGVAVDGSGNLFLADSGDGSIKEILAAQGYATVRTLGTGFAPGAIAVDSNGNVFVSDTDNHAVKEIVAVNGSIPASPVINILASGFVAPEGIVVDPNDNVFVADSGTNRLAVYELSAAGGYSTAKAVQQGFSGPSGLALDQKGNFHVVDQTYIDTLDRSDPPALNFATPTPPGSTDTADGPQSATLQNLGTTPLTLTGLAVSGSSFKLDSGTTTCTGATVLAPGASCTVGVDFSPVTTGAPITGTLTITDNTLNAPGSTQQIALSGSGLLAPTVTVTPASSSITSAQALTVTVAVTGGSGNPTPAGTVMLSGGGYQSAFAVLSNGSATINIPAGSLAAGTDTLTASFVPSSASAGVYFNATGSAMVNVTAQALTTPTVKVTPASAGITTAQSLSVAIAVSGNPAPTGLVTLSSGSYTSTATILTAGSATIVIPALALPPGTDTLTASYAPDSASVYLYKAATGTNSVTVAAAAAPSTSLNFGTVAIGQTSTASAMTFTFGSSVTLGSPVALTQGTPGLDFAVASSGTCASGASFTQGQTCTVNLTFAPRYSGLRRGAVVLNDSSGNAIAMGYLNGIGSGPQVSFLPYTQTALGGGFYDSASVAVDGSGNVFVADYSNFIQEVPPGCVTSSCVKSLGSGLNQASGVALDGAGNIFVADTYNSAVKEILAAGGYTTVKTLATGLSYPDAVAVDGSGNVFVADEGDPLSTDHTLDQVKEIVAAGGYTTVNTLGSGFIYPAGIAVDASGNVFVSNTGVNEVQELTAASNYTTTLTVGSGFHTPAGIALDGNGNLYVADSNNNALKEVLAAGGYTTVNTLASYTGVFTPNGVAVDATGNIYIAGPDGDQGVYKLDYADAPTIAFSTTTSVGATDTLDGTKTITLQNIGNAGLSLTGFSTPTANFSTAGSATICAASSTIAAGASCAVAIQFEPTVPGALSGTITWTDNALNVAGYTQTSTLSGTAESAAAPPAPVLTSQPANPTGTTTATFTFTDTQAGVTFVCSLDGAAYSACVSGVSYSSLSNGPQTFAVKAQDSLGNLSVATTYNWTTTAVPTPEITAAPANPASSTTAVFQFSDAQAGVTYACSLDGAPFASCTSGVSYASLANGAHSFAVEAKDSQGNPSNPAVYNWTVASAVSFNAGTPVDFGTVPVGQASAAIPITYTFASSTVLGAPEALTQGAPGLDFSIAASNTCLAGASFGSGSSCTVSVLFKPQYAGARNGAVVLKDSSGNTLAMLYVYGTGSGPEVRLVSGVEQLPSSETNLGGGFNQPSGVAVDGAGNVYVADFANSAVKEIPPGCTTASCVVTLGGGFNQPRGVAVDGAGNVFVADWGNDGVKEIPPGCLSATCVLEISNHYNGANAPYGVAVDGSGNVFVANLGSNSVNELLASSGYTTSNTLGSEFAQPEGVAVDGTGNVFVVQTGETPSSGCLSIACFTDSVALLEIPAAGGYSAVKTLVTDLNAPIFVAVDGVGNVYLTYIESENGVVQELFASSNYAESKDIALDRYCGGDFYCDRSGVAVDGAGNVYVAQVDEGINVVTKLDFTDPPTIAFPTATTAGQLDYTDDEEFVIVENNGNAPLNLSAITPSTNFGTVDTSEPCAVGTAVAPGTACSVGLYYAPTASGATSGTLTLTGNNLNAAGSSQLVNLTGTGLVPAPTLDTEPAYSTSATTAAFTFSDAEAGVTYLCKLDSAAYAACASGVSYSSLTLASHTFSVEAKDSHGSVSPATTFTWTVTAPSVATTPPPPPVITSGPPYVSTSTTATITFTDSEAGVTFLCGLNTAAVTCNGNSVTLTGLAYGNYTFDVFAEDSAGNINFNAAVLNFAVEPALPAPPSTAGVFGTLAVGKTSAPLTLTVTATAAGTLSRVAALTQGAPGLDFALASGGTCKSGLNLSVGSTCTVNATFSPRAPGRRSGAVVLYDGATPANVLATVYVSGTGSGPAIAFDPGIINTIAGGGTGCAAQTDSLGDGCLAIDATLGNTRGEAVDGAGNVYIADEFNARIRKVTKATGIITTIAGTGTDGFSGDGGPAANAEVWGPVGVTVDGAGNVFIADTTNHRIRRIDASTGIITTVAGNGTAGPGGDFGPATSAELDYPFDVQVDGLGDLFISDTGNDRIREVISGTGIITTVAGNGPGILDPYLPGGTTFTGSYGGDGGLATAALLDAPSSVAFDSAGNLYIADEQNNRIRKVDAATGIISTIAGTGYSVTGVACGGYNGDNIPATTAELSCPYGVAVDAADNIYIADYYNQRVRKVDPTTGIITTVAGNGTVIGGGFGGFGGDGGPATSAELGNPDSIVVDGQGNLFIGDYVNGRIRKVDVSDPPFLTFPSTATGTTSAAQDATVANIGNSPLTFTSIAASSNFTLGGADTSCLLSGEVLQPTTNCVLGIEFAPQAPGLQLGTATLVDNALNASGATQLINLSGTATGAAAKVAPTVKVTPSAASITSAQTLSVSVAVTGPGGQPTPTGVVTLTSGTSSFAAATLNGGSAIILIPSGLLATGTQPLSVSYAPDSASSAIYTSASGSSSVSVTAATVQVTVGTSLAGASFTVDGTTYTTTQTLSWIAGSSHTLATVAPAASAGTQIAFASWSDGGPISHTVTAPASAASYIASFSTSYQLTIAANPSNGGTVSPSSSAFYASGTVVSLVAIPSSGYTFSSWTGNVASSSSASTTVSMSAPQTVTANFTIIANLKAKLTSTLAFPNTAALSTSAPLALTLSNTGNATLTISSIALGGVNPTSFALTSGANACATTLAAGASCSIYVTFTPASVNSFSATVTVTDNATPSTQSATLTGAGIINAQSISFTPPASPVAYAPGLTIPLVATGGASGNAIVFSLDPASTGTGTIAAGTLTVTGVGTFVIDANQAGNANYSAAPQVSRTVVVTKAAQAITFTQPTSPVTYVSGLTIPLVATGGQSGNPVLFSIDSSSTGAGSISGSTLTVTGTGTFVIDANQAGNANYAAAPQVSRTIVVNSLIAQAITFAQPASPVSYAPSLTIALNATGGASGNPVVFSLDPASTATGSISGSTLTVTGVGTLVIDANQAGNTTYSAAPQVSRTIQINPASQTIAFPQPTSPVTYSAGLSISLAATGGPSGSAVVFTLDPASTATGSISGSTLTVTSAGTLVIDANQAGNADYSAAPQVSRTVVVNKAAQTISFTQPTSPVIYSSGLTIPLVATGGSSGNAVVFSIDPGSTATGSITGSTVTVTSMGTLVIDANQAGNTNYAAAPQVSRTIQINAVAAQTITFAQPASPVTYAPGLTITLTATGGASGNPIVFSIDSASTATGSISGSNLTVTGTGTLVIDANQAGNADYSAAPQVSRTIQINPAPQIIIFTQPTSPVVYIAGLTLQLSATGGASGNPVVFSIDSTSTATGSISGSTLTVTGTGTLVIDANQAGNADYSAAPQVSRTIQVNAPTDFTIAVTPPSQSISGNGSAQFTISVASSSGALNDTVALSVSGLPADATASFSPSSIAPGQSTASSTLTVQLGNAASAPPHSSAWPLAAPALALMVLFPFRRLRKALRGRLLLLIVGLASMAGALSLSGCGGGFALSRPAQSYTLTITGTAGPNSHTATAQLTVK